VLRDKFTTSRTDFLEIWEPEPPVTLRACPDLYKGYFNFTYNMEIRHDRNVSIIVFSMSSNLSKTIKGSIVCNIGTYDCRQRHAL